MRLATSPERPPQVPPAPPVGMAIGRYVLYTAIASGGMASVHIGRMRGPAGFSRTVAIKRLHPQFACDAAFVSMLMDEARLAARVQHPNVVSVLDVVQAEGELFLVMDFIRGEALGKLARALRARGQPVPPDIAVAILSNVLHGLHAAHEVRDERGELLHLVHRDVSPQNVLVGVDGVARLVDFGVAKAGHRLQTTRAGELKGKLDYMAPEQIERGEVTRRVDIYAASVVLWEILTGRRLVAGDDVAARLMQTLKARFLPPSAWNPRIGKRLDPIVMRGLARDPNQRWATAREMALALEQAMTPATASTVGEWAVQVAAGAIDKRDRMVAEVESISQRMALPPAADDGQRDSAGWSVHSEVRLHTAPDPGELRAPLTPSARPVRRRVRVHWIALLSALVALGLGLFAFGRTAERRAPRAPAVATASASPSAVPAPPPPVAQPTADAPAQETPSTRAHPARSRQPVRRAEAAPRSEWSSLTRH